jgi:hypothetical protein
MNNEVAIAIVLAAKAKDISSDKHTAVSGLTAATGFVLADVIRSSVNPDRDPEESLRAIDTALRMVLRAQGLTVRAGQGESQ